MCLSEKFSLTLIYYLLALIGQCWSQPGAQFETHTLLDDSGTVELDEYGPNHREQWIIRPNGFGHLTFLVDSISLEEADGRPGMLSPTGCHDFVRIISADKGGYSPCNEYEQNHYVDLCSLPINGTIDIESPVVTIEFCANPDTQLDGFKIEYAFVYDPPVLQATMGDDVTYSQCGMPQDDTGSTTTLFDAALERHRKKRMINGWESRAHSWPWAAAIFDSGAQHEYMCAGALVAKQWVLSAAHCFHLLSPSRYSNLRVKLGAHKRGPRGVVNEPTQQLCGVSKVIMNEPYHPHHNDMALLKLDCKAEYNAEIQPICLPPAGKGEFWQTSRQHATAVGWGLLNAQSQILAETLHEANFYTEDHSICTNEFGGYIQDTVVCTKGRNVSYPSTFCFGDSGGPLMTMYQNRWTVIGVASFNLNCDPTKYSFYSFVPMFTGWIRGLIGYE